jgi:hypothetical protein
MRLYDVQLPARIYFFTFADGSTYVDVDHLDGSFSFGETERGAVVHLAASAHLFVGPDGHLALGY